MLPLQSQAKRPATEQEVYDSDSSLELDESLFTDENVVDVHQLPAELVNRDPGPFDLSSNEGEDHTGFWANEDINTLLLAANKYRQDLKGNFVGASGGKKRRDDAWDSVKEYVNRRCNTDWNVRQCKDKLRKFCQEAKEEYNRLKQEIAKTGGGEFDDSLYLTADQELALEYVGVEGVFGVPGVHAVSLIPDEDQGYMDLDEDIARKAWDFMDSKKEQYTSLPRDKVKVGKPKRKTPVFKKKKTMGD